MYCPMQLTAVGFNAVSGHVTDHKAVQAHGLLKGSSHGGKLSLPEDLGSSSGFLQLSIQNNQLSLKKWSLLSAGQIYLEE